jgi:hypothetical protein
MTARHGCLLATVVALLLLAPSAADAAGGRYRIDGGTAAERAQIAAALDASSFDWSLVPVEIEIHVARGSGSYATPGQIWLDPDLLDAGRFAWGVVQHEYAHQVDFFCLTDTTRAELQPLLGGQAWWSSPTNVLPHAQLTAERFASTLAWSYWASPDNVMRPQRATDESAAMPPAAFRALIQRDLGLPGAYAESQGLASLGRSHLMLPWFPVRVQIGPLDDP